MPIQSLPTSLLYQILQNVTFPTRWEAALVCRSWYAICHDPYLYQEIQLEYMELRTLINTLKWIERLGCVSAKQLIFRHCYSDFLQQTLVPVPFLAPLPNQPKLYRQLRSLTPDQRRREYIKQDYRLYDELSDILLKLLKPTLTMVDISHCDLDLDMTELFMLLTTHGAHLTTWIYYDNYNSSSSGGKHRSKTASSSSSSSSSSSVSPSSDLLQAIIMACPNMKHFVGHHNAVNDAVIFTMARHWPHLETLVLDTSTHQSVSAKAFYALISKCTALHTLSLYDIECINSDDLQQMCLWRNSSLASSADTKRISNSISRRQQRRLYSYPYPSSSSSSSPSSSLPLARAYSSSSSQARISRDVIDSPVGTSLRHVKLTKYVTTPLTRHAVLQLLTLFPRLQTLVYETNVECYQIANETKGKRYGMKDWQQLALLQHQLVFPPNCRFIPILDSRPTMEQLVSIARHNVMNDHHHNGERN